MQRVTVVALLVCSLLGIGGCAGPERPVLDPDNTLILTVETGPVVIAMRPDLAPRHIERIKALVRAGAFDGTNFERGIKNYLVQVAAMRSEDLAPLPGEFSDVPFERGTVGMARGADPDSARGSFFIALGSLPNLDGQFTVWGEVVRGMPFVEQIRKSRTGPNGFIGLEQDDPPEPRYVEVPGPGRFGKTPTFNPYSLPPTRLEQARVMADVR